MLFKDDRFWLVSSGKLKKHRVKARDPREAFITAVAIYRPEAIGQIAQVVAETIDDEVRAIDPEGTWILWPHWLTEEFQGLP